MSKEKILEEFEINYLAEYRWKKDRINNLSAVDWLSQAIDQTREEMIREVEEINKLVNSLHNHPGAEIRLGVDKDHIIVDDYTLEEIKQSLKSLINK